ncbi:hypothetical protein GOARA_063_01340 [Gordonia araii NBRC 100433]|uniref:DUF222 domain-containing protein n=1 Tax=Gordonia araii NBRC 100433 TaxID=1073574 RepID=G7H510_9ACTN|nr:hypothetical protein GOARA_063_01340 [Gordonia araii NBRC 100433]
MPGGTERSVDYDIAEGFELPETPLALALLIDAATAKLADVAMGLASDAEVMGALKAIETARRRSAGVDAALLVEISDRNLYRIQGHSSVRRFLAQDLRLGPTEAKRRYETVLAIGKFTSLSGQPLPPSREPVAAGVAEGEISADHIHEIEAILAKVPSLCPNADTDRAVDILATAARTMAPQDLKPIGQRLLAHLDPDGKLTDDTDRQRQRGLTLCRQDRRLMSKITGEMTPALRAKFEVILHNWAAPGMNNPDDEHPVRGSIADLGESERDALADAVKRDTRTPAQRNHDALDTLCEWVLGHQALGRPDRIPAQLVVTAELSQLTSLAAGHPNGAALTTTGTLVPVADLIEVAAEANPWLEVFADKTREILDFGRGKRIATFSQRLALFGRDRGCTRPGCTEPFIRTQAHHAAADYAKGGRTDAAELTGACGPDNRNVGDKPGNWETTVITSGPEAGRIGWRMAGSDQPYRTNPVHHPEAFLKHLPSNGGASTGPASLRSTSPPRSSQPPQAECPRDESVSEQPPPENATTNRSRVESTLTALLDAA